MVKISVIMPVYNGEKYLNNSILSLSKQSLKDFELICIDDGSSDNSLEVLNDLSKKYDFIRILKQDNQGSGKARNYGIDEALGEYIAFLDADDFFVDENALEEMYNAGVDYDADMVAGNLCYAKDNKILRNHNPNYDRDFYYYCSKLEKISPKDYGIPWAFYKNIFKKDFIKENNIYFPDYKRGQDPVFLAEILTSIDFMVTVPVCLYAYSYDIGGGSRYKNDTPEKRLGYIKNYFDCFNFFDNAGFYESSYKYKQRLVGFITTIADEYKREYWKVIHKVFEEDNPNYFENLDAETAFLQLCIIDPNSDYLSKAINDVDKNLFKIYLKDGKIPESIMDKYSEILSNNKEDSITLSKDLFNFFSKEINDLKKENKRLLSSKSWRITAPLRKLKRKL
ncbi:glycosyltransferase family 2 protein [Methanobrevibacter boviskoreani]|uniref:glycosyltransferase family 2 protein n=1 Tax=Methanobrevibacter boviskoreani TaxID=1348249 RepID=UPI0006ACCB73|nr:glycosyltransferase family 2 protein [Methanobrevibacter boviskoreani]